MRNKFLKPQLILSNAVAMLFLLLLFVFAVQKNHAVASDLNRLHAAYKINFNDFELGDFKFWSEMSNNRYSILGKGELSILRGIFFKWEATTKSSGRLTKRGPKPKSFSFEFSANSKEEKIDMRFRNNTVTQVIHNPPRTIDKPISPIQKNDLKKVFDPMSAIIALISAANKRSDSGSEICDITLPMFDGRERYDLSFSHKKTVHMSKTNKQGYSGPAHICRVRYMPISGHELDNEGTKFMAKSKEIEVWMVPVPDAKFNLPYHIVIPTLVGYVTVTSQIFQVEKPDGQIAFVN